MPTYQGTSGTDVFTAPDNQDWTIIGKGGADTLTGGAGNDVFDAGKGNDILNGGGGNDVFLVGIQGGTDFYDGGDTAYIGADGFDEIRAIADNVRIGIASITGIESITANGFANVEIYSSTDSNVLDFTNVTLNGIAKISGGAGSDIITGSALADVIDGGTGDDILKGGTGDDVFLIGSNAGNDAIDGGIGLDTVRAAANNARIAFAGLTGIEAIDGGAFLGVKVVGTDGDDLIAFKTTTLTNIAGISGGDGNDIITGTAGDDTLYGDDGDDILNGGNGNDNIYGGKGHDVLNGGSGDDSFYSSDGADVYNGGSGYDVIYASRNNASIDIDQGLLKGIEEISANGFTGVTIRAANAEGSLIDLRHTFLSDDDILSINGGNGSDTIFGSFTYDYIFGGLGDDTLNGYNGDDELHGGAGSDTLTGGAGYDTLYGDAGNDILNGGSSDDILFGGTGDDILIASSNGGFDEFHGDAGIDIIQAEDGNKLIKIAQIDGVEAIKWDGSHIATILGTSSNDSFDFSGVTFTGISSINAGDGNDTITGTLANDVVLGGAGDDMLLGNGGSDILTGGDGIDVLTGGSDSDIFSDKAAGLNGDRITDFTAGDSIRITNASDVSKIVLSYIADEGGASGTLHIVGAQALKAGIDIHLDGAFTSDSFAVASDGASGAYITFAGDIPLL